MSAPQRTPAEIMGDLIDQIRLLRQDVGNLAASHPGKQEAAAVAASLRQAVDGMTAMQDQARVMLRSGVEDSRILAAQAARDAARTAIAELQADLSRTARSLSEAAGEARKEAWRYFGGFWVWLVAVGCLGLVLGLLMAFWLHARGDAREFGRNPGFFCSQAGGQIAANNRGQRFCAVWIDRTEITAE